MGVGVYGERLKQIVEKNVSNLEWKSEGVVDDDSGDNKGDEVKKID